MLTSLYTVGLSALLFLLFYIGYREGLRLGMRSSRGVEPKSPVRYIQERKEVKAAKEAAQQQQDEWDAIEQCDGYTDEERALINKGGEQDG